MKIENLKPTPVVLDLGGIKFPLRFFNVEDEIWLQKEFGENINKIFAVEKTDMAAVAKIVYHQVVDKSPFARIEEKTFDEEGVPKTIQIGGWKRLLRMVIVDEDKLSMITSVTKCFTASRPEPSTEKKKKTELKTGGK